MLAMMTQELGFSVLTAPIAALDRRALSQAWYSALHLAHDERPAAPTAKAAPKSTTAAERADAPAVRSTRGRDEHCAIAIRRECAPPRSRACEEDRRSVRSPLARKIERVFLHPSQRPERATFSLDGGRARVAVTLQSTPQGLRLIAVCPKHSRGAVARALDEARFALASRGIALDASVSESADVRQ